MATVRNSNSPKRKRPAATPQARENQLVAAAVDLAEKQIQSGTVSAQVLTHYLKLATEREALERTKLRHENHLLEVKTEQIQSAQRMEELYSNAIDAMRGYSGLGSDDDDLY